MFVQTKPVPVGSSEKQFRMTRLSRRDLLNQAPERPERRPAICNPQRQILGIVGLNGERSSATHGPTIRKPFDALAEGLVSENSRGDRTPIEIFIVGVRGWEAACGGSLTTANSDRAVGANPRSLLSGSEKPPPLY